MKQQSKILFAAALTAAMTAGLFSAPQAGSAPGDKTKGFFPVSVWYAGGKARAPCRDPQSLTFQPLTLRTGCSPRRSSVAKTPAILRFSPGRRVM